MEPTHRELGGGDTTGRPGERLERRARVLLHDLRRPAARDLVVPLTRQLVINRRDPRPRDGRVPVLNEEYPLVEEILAGDERWLGALAARGLDPATIRVAPLSAGVYEDERSTGDACCAAWLFSRSTRPIMPGRIRSAGWWRTST